MAFVRDLRVAVYSLFRTPGLAVAVILTLALGIGANAAIFTLVRGILLKPLVNRDEARLIYVRQSAPGIDTDNTTFSVPEIQDLKASVKSVGSFGEFSAMGFTMVGLGEPRTIKGGVASGTFFDVMGLHPVLGRLIGPQDDGPKRRRCRGSHISFLEQHSQSRPQRHRETNPPGQHRRPDGDHHWRA